MKSEWAIFFFFFFFEKLNGQKWNKKIQILVSGGMSYIKKISNLAEKKNMMLKFSKLSSLATKIFNLKSV